MGSLTRTEEPVNERHDNATACMCDCTFCGGRFPSETLTSVVFPADDQEPEMTAEVCGTCLVEAKARGALPREAGATEWRARTSEALLGALASFTVTAELLQSEHGVPQPTIVLRTADRRSWRKRKAALHVLAAIVQLETPSNEGWLPEISDGYASGCVYLELLHGTEHEARRGIQMLRAVAARLEDA